MYDTIDPSPGDFWGFADWNQVANTSFPSVCGCKWGPDVTWMRLSKSKGAPYCSQAVSSRVNPSVAQVKTKQCNQGEVFKMSLQSMFGNQVQS